MTNITIEEITKNELFKKYFDFLIDYNEKVNLTAITDKNEVYEKHFLDSVQCEHLLTKNSKILDVGAGAGLPSVPLAIFRKDLKFTLLDSLNKRIIFLSELKKFLKLENINPEHARIEDFSENNREKFDFVVARAVAPLPILLEYCSQCVKIEGKIILYKGSSYEEELLKSQNAQTKLKLKLEKIEKYSLKNCSQDRFLLVFSKISSTPSIYPRKNNKPRTMPL